MPADSPPLPYRAPAGPLYRIARKPDAWTPPDWAYVGDDGTFGNRYDDFDGYFRVLYAASSPLACFVETLARFLPPPHVEDLIAVFNRIENAPNEQISFGRVPLTWLDKRTLGQAVSLRTRFADVYSAEWVSYLRRHLEPARIAPHLKHRPDFDLALLLSQDRSTSRPWPISFATTESTTNPALDRILTTGAFRTIRPP